MTVTATGAQNVVIRGSEPTPGPEPEPEPGPGPTPGPTPTPAPEIRDIFTQSVIEAEVERDSNQEIRIPLKNTAQTPVEYYLTVNNPYSDLSMNFVGEGSEGKHGVLLTAGESNAVLNVFAQEAEGTVYNNITLTAHVNDHEFTRTLSLTVAGAGLDLEYEVEDIDGGVEITLTNNGVDVNSLKVRADDALSNYAFFPVAITSYQLPSDESVEFQVLASGVSGSVSGNILAIGNGGRVEIPVTLREPEPERVTARDLALADNEFKDIQPDEDSLEIDDDGVISYSLSDDWQSIPVHFYVSMEGVDEMPAGDWNAGIKIEESGDATINFSYYMSMEEYAQLASGAVQGIAALMDAETANGVLVHFGFDIELDDWDELVDQFNAAIAQNSDLQYVRELPKNTRQFENARKSYTLTLQMEILLNLLKALQESDSGTYQNLIDKFKEEIVREFAPGSVTDPIALLEQILAGSKESLIQLYPDLVPPVEETSNNPTEKINFPDYQCTNRGSISAPVYVRDHSNNVRTQNASLFDGNVTAADRGIRVFYSGRIYSEDNYVNFEPVDYDLYINGNRAGVTQNSGLSELNIIELDASKILVGRTNTFMRDYRTNPGSHFINTDNEFIIVYPADAVLDVTESSPVEAALPDFDIYRKNIFAYGPNSTYTETPCAGENTLHVSISNRGAHGGYYQITVRNGDETILTDGEHDFHYLSPFTSTTLELPVILHEGSNRISVEITDVTGYSRETVTDNNRATMTITARPRQIPEITSLSPSGAVTVSGNSIDLTAQVSRERDIEKVTFYLDNALVGTMSGVKSAYYANTPITEGQHTLKAEVSYFSGGTTSADTTVVTRETTFTVSIQEAETPWGEVIFPESSNISRSVRTSLLRWDADSSKYSEADFSFSVTSDSGGVYHLFADKQTANPQGMTLVIYDSYNEKLYAGPVGVESAPISVLANRILTFTNITFADTDISVYLPGLRRSYTIGATSGETSVSLPALFFSSVHGDFLLNPDDADSINLTFDNVDLTAENRTLDISERVTTYAVTFPEASVTVSDALLLTYNAEDEEYDEASLDYGIQAHAENDYRLLVVRNADDAPSFNEMILVVHDENSGRLYAGAIGEPGAPVALTCNRTLTLSDASIADESVEASIAGVYSSFTIKTQNGSSSISLPALIFDSVSGRFQTAEIADPIQVSLSDINLSAGNQTAAVADKFTAYTFTLPDGIGSSNPFTAYYLYSYTSGSRSRYSSARMSASLSSNRMTAVLEKSTLYGRTPANANIFLYTGSRTYNTSTVQPSVLLIPESSYVAGMSVAGIATNQLILTADDTEKLTVTRVTFTPGEYTHNATLYFSDTGSGQVAIFASPISYSCGISFRYNGQSYTTTQTVDLSAGNVTLNLSEIALVATLQVRWDSAYDSNALVRIQGSTAGANTTTDNYEAGSIIRLQPGTYDVNVSLNSGDDAFEFSSAALEIAAGRENVITIGKDLSGTLVFDDYESQTNIPALNPGANIRASLSDLRDEHGNLLIQHSGRNTSGFIVFSRAAGGNIESPVQFSEGYMSPLNISSPIEAGTYAVSFRSYDVEVQQAVITASAGVGGTISPNGGVTVNKGESVTFSIQPSNGYVIEQVMVDNSPAGAVSSYSFSNIQENHTISVIFRNSGNGAVNNDTSSGTSGGGSSGRSGGSSSTARTEIVIQSDHGSIQVSPENPIVGTVVKATVTPDDGYELDAFTVTDLQNRDVKVTKQSGKYTFTAKTGKLTVKATFKQTAYVPVPTPTPTPAPIQTPDLMFTDVKAGQYYTDAVYWAVEHGVTNGLTNSLFGPDEGCTRAQMVTFLWRASGSPEPNSKDSPFTDVITTEFYYKAVLWACERGITLGTSETEFSPSAAVSRAHAVTFLHRSVNSPSVGETPPFTDVKQSDYFYEAVKWAFSNKVTLGSTSATFSPLDTCTRGQIVTFLYRHYVK